MHTMQDLSDTAALHRRHRRHLHRADRGARAQAQAREEHRLVIIDHIQLVASARRVENRVQEITEISKGLKVLAKELDVPVIALSQLSRSVDAATTSGRCCRIFANPAPSSRTPTS